MAQPGYSLEGLLHGIDHAKKNIKSLEVAIENERKTISDHRIMIDDIERSQKLKADAEAGKNVEIVDDRPH